MDSRTINLTATSNDGDNDEERLFNYCLNFLDSPIALKGPVVLDYKTRDALLEFCAKPMEQALYNGIINRMPESANYDDYVNAAAKLYYLQNKLNRKVGRHVYNYGSKDADLAHFIFCEFKKRRQKFFKDYQKGPDGETQETMKRRRKFEDDIFERFMILYPSLDNDYTDENNSVINTVIHRFKGQETINTADLMDCLNSYRSSKFFDDDGITDYYSYMVKCSQMYGWANDPSDMYRNVHGKERDSTFKRRPPSKKDLYRFAVMCGLDDLQFERLRNLVITTGDVNPDKYKQNEKDLTIRQIFKDMRSYWIEDAKQEAQNQKGKPYVSYYLYRKIEAYLLNTLDYEL